MNCRALTSAQAKEWRAALGALPHADVYYLPEYHRACEANGDGTAYAFVAEESGKTLFHPFMLRRIERVGTRPVETPLYDIQTVYGYTGPLQNCDDETFLRQAWGQFGVWCREQRAVAEFVRFHPLLENHVAQQAYYQVSLDRETVALRLDVSAEALWKSYTPVHRNMIRKAMNCGLCGELGDLERDLPEFSKLYGETMERANAGAYYSFPEAYFQRLREGLREHLLLFSVRAGGKPIAAALAFSFRDMLHYHLAGSDSAFRQAAPNNLLLHTMAEWGRSHGLRCFHLGGGRTARPDDELLRFKASVSRLRRQFHIGMRVHDQQGYERLCEEWLTQNGGAQHPRYFLLYRLETGTRT